MPSKAAIGIKYARALFAEAAEQGILEPVGAQLRGMHEVVRGNHDLKEFMVSPEVPTENKLALVQSVFASRTNPLVVQFLTLLVEKNRIAVLEEIIEAFEVLMDDHEGRVKARVVTAIPLDAAREQTLRAELSRITGKTVEVTQTVDASILGGVIVHLGNKIIDRSIRRGLREIRESLMRTELNEVKPA